MNDQEILIVGCGAMATYFAARLSASGTRVTMHGSWPEGLAALRQYGARLVDKNGVETAHPVKVADSPAGCAGASIALVLVKSWQTEHAANLLINCLSQNGLAITLQNGLGNREILQESLGSNRVAQGVTTAGATLLDPGLVRLGGEGTITLEAHPRMEPLVRTLKAAGFEVHVVANAKSLLWGKLVINAAINPLSALLRVPNGDLLKSGATRKLMAELAAETAAVAEARQIRLPFNDPAAAAEEVARRTATNHSSMLQDILRGAPTEIDAICGAVAREGDELGVPTPVNRTLWFLIKSQANLI